LSTATFVFAHPKVIATSAFAHSKVVDAFAQQNGFETFFSPSQRYALTFQKITIAVTTYTYCEMNIYNLQFYNGFQK
jgi:hypothetical protein